MIASALGSSNASPTDLRFAGRYFRECAIPAFSFSAFDMCTTGSVGTRVEKSNR